MHFSASFSTLSVFLLTRAVLARRNADYHQNLRDERSDPGAPATTQTIFRTVIPVAATPLASSTSATVDIVTVTDTSYVTVEWSDPRAPATMQTAATTAIPVAGTPPVPTTSATVMSMTIPSSCNVSISSSSTSYPTPPTTSTNTAISSVTPLEVENASTRSANVSTSPSAAVVYPTTMELVVNSTANTTTAVPCPSIATSIVAGNKRGVAYNDPSFTELFTSKTIDWAYNWDSIPSGPIRSGLEFVPLLWGLGSEHTSQWPFHASAAIASGSGHLLGFNEPDLSSQSNIDVHTAVAGWNQFMEPYSGKALLISPAVTNVGLSWLQNFVQQCTNCNIHCVAVHWYGSATNLQDFQQVVTQANKMTGKCVWVTEFAGSGSEDQETTFIIKAMAWLDSQNFVERYAYFMARQDSLISGAGLSEMGVAYNS